MVKKIEGGILTAFFNLKKRPGYGALFLLFYALGFRPNICNILA